MSDILVIEITGRGVVGVKTYRHSMGSNNSFGFSISIETWCKDNETGIIFACPRGNSMLGTPNRT